MTFSALLVRHTEAVLHQALEFSATTDGVLERYFKQHPSLGSRVRYLITQAVYAVLRNKNIYELCARLNEKVSVRRLSLLGLLFAGVEDLGLDQVENDWLEGVRKMDVTVLPVALQSNFPEWLFLALSEWMSEQEILALAQALNQPAFLDLRVNTLKTDRVHVLKALAALDIAAKPTPYSPVGLRLENKIALHNFSLFKEGVIEVQDEGSQLLAQLVGAKREEVIVDFCAGAGGKSLLLGASMKNTGRIYALDISEKRLAKCKPRLVRSGLSNIFPMVIEHERDAKVKRLVGKVDRVLVDAPCSGLGTLRRHPELKWRQTLASIEELINKQAAILESAASLVRGGGRLVYATCSILKQENEEQVKRFLEKNTDFKLIPVQKILQQQKIALQMNNYLILSPGQHQTDGFFAAVFERVVS